MRWCNKVVNVLLASNSKWAHKIKTKRRQFLNIWWVALVSYSQWSWLSNQLSWICVGLIIRFFGTRRFSCSSSWLMTLDFSIHWCPWILLFIFLLLGSCYVRSLFVSVLVVSLFGLSLWLSGRVPVIITNLCVSSFWVPIVTWLDVWSLCQVNMS